MKTHKSTLSQTMRDAIEFMAQHDNKLCRHDGGFWCGPTLDTTIYFSTLTVQALAVRGLIRYSQHKKHKYGAGAFAVEAELARVGSGFMSEAICECGHQGDDHDRFGVCLSECLSGSGQCACANWTPEGEKSHG